MNLQFRDVEWLDSDRMKVGGVQFNTSTTDYSRKTSATEVILLKNKGMLDCYRKLFSGEPIRNILEFGTWEGGSPLFFVAATNVERFVGIDLREPVAGLAHHIGPFADRLKLYYGISQSDPGNVGQIIDREFADPIDLVIDDASHMYQHTKAAFNIAFPRLRVGGYYIIEDWNWAHYPDRQFDEAWKDQPALSNLAMELVMAVGSITAVASIEVRNWCLIIRKGSEVGPDFSIDDLVRLGDRRSYVKF